MWHGLEQLSKNVDSNSLNSIWGKQDGAKYRYFQVIIWQFESEEAIEEGRQEYETGEVLLGAAELMADDVLPNSQTSTDSIAGSKVFNLTSSSAKLQIDQLTITTGIYNDYGIGVWTFDAPKKSSDIWAELVDLIGGKAETPESPPPTPTATTIKSTSGSIGAFAYDWWWSKERNQDGKYGETSVTIDLPAQSVSKATLYVGSGYSQQSGSAKVTVYISTEQQVTPPDADHDRDSWWLGNTGTLGQKLGEFSTSYGNKNIWSVDITSFVNQNLSRDKFYVSFENHANADVGISPVYIEAIPAAEPTPEPEPPTPSPSPEPEPMPESTPTLSPAAEKLLTKIDKAEQATLITVLTDEYSFLNAAVDSKIRFGFLVGRVLEKHDVDLELLKTILGSDLYNKLDYAYDLDKIDSLRSHCKNNDFDEFSRQYREYATQKVRAEFSFAEAAERIEKGFEGQRNRVRKGELGADNPETAEAILNSYIVAIREEMGSHDEAMYQSQEAAKTIDQSMNIIGKLTSLADKLFGDGLDKAKITSDLSLVWAQNQIRYWTTCTYIWGGTDKLKDNKLEQLRKQYNLFERQEFYYGTVFAVETGIQKLIRGEPIE